VKGMDDFLSTEQLGPLRSETDKLSRNLLRLRLDGAQVVIRPSGTEPKVKVYTDIEGRKLTSGNDRRAAEALARSLADEVFDACIERINVRLSPSAKLLPDHVDLDLKKAFDENFRPDLLAAAVDLSKKAPQERLQWLSQKLSAYGAGADPLEAVSRAVIHLCESLRAVEPDHPEAQKALLAIENQLREAQEAAA
jgi:hypothetical protein